MAGSVWETAMEVVDEAYFERMGWGKDSAERRNSRRPHDLGEARYEALVSAAQREIEQGIVYARAAVLRRLP